eukprot:TRINITY_DN10526_c0_g1_i1.p1 TRINITY_DN10526_c0_g1~~TRINITY_DN10526_c0_g1_i1.p1  ORF type:complete len:649 (+),score=121.47 TRINITY_DN10526_c0_g1_i1:76-2022(+)
MYNTKPEETTTWKASPSPSAQIAAVTAPNSTTASGGFSQTATSSTPEKKAKKKNLPNATSAASRWKKNFNIKKTQMIQKIGGMERTVYLSEFKRNNEQCKKLTDVLGEFVKLASAYFKGARAYVKEGVAFSDSMMALVELQSGAAEATIKVFCQTEGRVQFHRDALYRKEAVECVDTVEAFMRDDIALARRAKNSFRDARIQFDAANGQLNSVLPKGGEKPMELFLAYTHHHYAKRKYDRRLMDASNKLKDAIEKKEFDLLEGFCKLMNAQKEQYGASFGLLYNLGPVIADLNAWIKVHQQNAERERHEKEEQKLMAKRQAEKQKFRPFVELLAAPDLALVSALCLSAGDRQNETLETLIRILDAYKLTLPIIKIGITQEVKETASEAQLFRTNSTATKLMSSFTRMTGQPYLISTLRSLVTDLAASTQSFEVNPDKAKEGEDISANMNALLEACQKFMDVIFLSITDCPLPFRVMASHLRKECTSKFPGTHYKSVGGFIILRFFCPALLTADKNITNGITLDADKRRALLLIGKTIQSLANEVPFGAKEEYMVPVNELIDKNKELMHDYFDQLATAPNLEDYTPLAAFDSVNTQELPSIQSFIFKHLDKIAEFLRKHEFASTIPLLAHIIAQLDTESPLIATSEKLK